MITAIVTKDTPEILLKCLRSVSYLGARHFIINNGGDSGCYANEIDLPPQNKPCIYEAFNVALSLGQYDNLMLINSDCVIDTEGWQCIAQKLFDENPKVGILSPMQWRYEGKKKFICYAGTQGTMILGSHLGGLDGTDAVFERPRNLLWATAGCIIYRKECLEDAGIPFDTNYTLFNADAKQTAMIRMAGWQIRYTPEISVYHNEHYTINKFISEKQLKTWADEDRARFHTWLATQEGIDIL